MRPIWGSNPKLTDRLIVGRDVTLSEDSVDRTVEWQPGQLRVVEVQSLQ
jgi:hypothetical protein